jgi:CRP/FNR family cyclic AMP-dependent transcriptional regulator
LIRFADTARKRGRIMRDRPDSWFPNTVMARLLPEEREALLASGTRVEFPHGSSLVWQGDDSTDFFVLLDGFVKVVATTKEGTPRILAVRARGDLIGELMAIAKNGERVATVVAINTVVAVRISEQRYERFANRFPRAKDVIVVSVVDKMRAASQRRTEDHAWDVRTRLARMICYLADTYGVRSEGEIFIPLQLSQFELAEMVGAGESTVERLLHEFRTRGWVRTSYQKLFVLDLPALRALWEDR